MHIYMNPYVFVAGARPPKGRVRRAYKYIKIDVYICLYIYVFIYIYIYIYI